MAHRGNRHNARGKSYRKQKDEMELDTDQERPAVDESSSLIQMFRGFQQELDTRNDRNERIVKLSRDITIESKRLIFMLHRIKGAAKREDVLKDAEEKFKELYRSKFAPLAVELQGQDSYQFLRAFSPGLQEYIEAVTFYYFLKQNELVGADKIKCDINSVLSESSQLESTSITSVTESIPVEENKNSLTESSGVFSGASEVSIPLTEYMLGIADFTGELMRMAINSVGAGDLDTPKEVTELMRVIHNAFASFSNAPRELRRKATVLRQSLQKVENACYNLRVRGSEIPKHMLADVFTTSHTTLPDDNFLGETDDIL